MKPYETLLDLSAIYRCVNVYCKRKWGREPDLILICEGGVIEAEWTEWTGGEPWNDRHVIPLAKLTDGIRKGKK